MNKVFITGRLTRDPEIRSTQTGKKVAQFSIAVNKFGKDETTYFFNVTTWEKLAEIVEAYAKKGTKVAIIGELSQDEYTNKEGQKVKNIYILAKEVELLGERQQLNSETEAPEVDIDSISVQMPF